MAIALDTVVGLSNEQASADVSDEVVVVNLSSGRYYGLDPVGARVWDLLRTKRRVEEIRDALLDEYDVDRETCGRDLLALIGRLAEAGLVEVKA